MLCNSMLYRALGLALAASLLLIQANQSFASQCGSPREVRMTWSVTILDKLNQPLKGIEAVCDWKQDYRNGGVHYPDFDGNTVAASGEDGEIAIDLMIQRRAGCGRGRCGTLMLRDTKRPHDVRKINQYLFEGDVARYDLLRRVTLSDVPNKPGRSRFTAEGYLYITFLFGGNRGYQWMFQPMGQKQPVIVEPFDSGISFGNAWQSTEGALATALDKGRIVQISGIFEDARFSWDQNRIDRYHKVSEIDETAEPAQKIVSVLRVSRRSIHLQARDTRSAIPAGVLNTNRRFLERYPRLLDTPHSSGE